MIGEDGRPRRLETTKSLCPHTHFGTGDRVRVVFDGRYDLSPGLCTSFKRQAITLFEALLLGRVQVFSVLIILQVSRITTSKDGFATSQTLRFWTTWKDWASSSWRGLSSEAFKIDSAALWWPSIHMAAVDLLDENEVFERLIGLTQRYRYSIWS